MKTSPVRNWARRLGEGDALEGHLRVSREANNYIRTLEPDGCFSQLLNTLEKDNERLGVINHLHKMNRRPSLAEYKEIPIAWRAEKAEEQN